MADNILQGDEAFVFCAECRYKNVVRNQSAMLCLKCGQMLPSPASRDDHNAKAVDYVEKQNKPLPLSLSFDDKPLEDPFDKPTNDKPSSSNKPLDMSQFVRSPSSDNSPGKGFHDEPPSKKLRLDDKYANKEPDDKPPSKRHKPDDKPPSKRHKLDDKPSSEKLPSDKQPSNKSNELHGDKLPDEKYDENELHADSANADTKV